MEWLKRFAVTRLCTKAVVVVNILVVLLYLTTDKWMHLLQRGKLTQSRLGPGRSAAPCPNMHFSSHSLPKTALASFPGSGNTWIRHLFQQATGIYTGSIYVDSVLKRNGFPGEGVINGSVTFIKTHVKPSNKYEKAVLLVRNPYECILSEFNRQKSKSHTGIVPYSRYQTGEWNSFVKRLMGSWRSLNVEWIRNFKGPLHVTFYEDLKSDTRNELTKISKFLDVPVTFMECAMQDLEGKFLRKNKTDYRLLYDNELRELADKNKLDVYQAAFFEHGFMCLHC